ncbi:hypothetical protein PVAG01_05001 [Phlyctema vagabunda]|uniref:Utp8 beta-propeller domain-containing protein n=1 Tax=Phlyctema vagabunda TaxID=108571 RepID=A0ABR4PIZ1_9HELO
MASRFSIQQPFVVAPLPQPIDHPNGRYVVGEVHGGTPGSKKRKRSEVTVGIHGEGVNLYDITSSRLITSYAIPPQSSFTCAPCSLRTRISKNKIERRTYVSTAGPQPSITLFEDLATGPGTASVTSSTLSSKLDPSSASVVFLGAITSRSTEEASTASDLLVVREDGEIQCLDGTKLEKRWVSPASALYRDNATAGVGGCKVEFAHLTNAYAASQGILKGRQDVLATFSQEVTEHGFNPDVLVLITTPINGEIFTRTVHLLTLPRKLLATSTVKQSVDCLLSAILPRGQAAPQLKRSFNVHASAGLLQELAGGVVTTYDLNETLPKLQSEFVVPGATSFLRLSSASVMVSSDDSIGVFNPKFQSVLATISTKLIASDASHGAQESSSTLDISAASYTLVAHFPKLSTVIAHTNNALVAIQLENQHLNKSHGSSLLIDSLGRAIHHQGRTGDLKNKGARSAGLTTLESYLPGVISNTRPPWAEQIAQPDQLFANEDIDGFDAFFEAKFTSVDLPINGAPATPSSDSVDRRWISYVLQKIFAWSSSTEESQRLSIKFYPHKVFVWLLQTGNLTVANLEVALRDNLHSSDTSIPAGQLINVMVDLDPEMALLLTLLESDYLGAADLLHAIKHLMNSLEIFGDGSTDKQGLLTNGTTSENPHVNADEEFERLEAQAEEDLRLAEYHLGVGSGVRGQALSTALAKLYTCPSSAIVQALQTTMTGQEVVSLIYLLRFELVRGSWTSRYLDIGPLDTVDDDAAEGTNSTIILVSSLLNNCIDAIGAGGWLTGDAKLVNGDFFESEDLIKSLKLEVSAALDGIEEASYLKGLTSEFVRYGRAMQAALPRVAADQADSHMSKKRKVAPVILPSDDKNVTLLPFGLKAEQQISRLRIGAGGEVQKRTARDIGRLKSKKIGKYSLERINI